MSYEVPFAVAQNLGFSLQSAVTAFTQALLDHRLTVGVPAPIAHPLVERIVRSHGGQFNIGPQLSEPEPAPQPPGPLGVTFAQLLIGLVAVGWITESEGEAWLDGTLPQPALDAIGGLPLAMRFAAKVRAIRPSVVFRDDPIVNAMAAKADKTPEEVTAFFVYASQL
jgi:hypothetical protein